MLRRVVPAWRLVGYAYKDDVNPDTDVPVVAAGPFHEIRFIDEPRPDRPRTDRTQVPLALPVLFSRIRTAQAQQRAVTPILVRLPGSQSGNGLAKTPARVAATSQAVPRPTTAS